MVIVNMTEVYCELHSMLTDYSKPSSCHFCVYSSCLSAVYFVIRSRCHSCGVTLK